MGRRKIFGITRYREIQKKGSAPCTEYGCEGKIKYIRTRHERPESEVYFEDTYFYRCTRNCRHHWKVIKNSLDDRLIFMKY